MKTPSTQRVIQESMEEYCRRIVQELSDFLNASPRSTTKLDEWGHPPDPIDLPIQSSAVVGDVTEGELYSEVLLPRFLKFAQIRHHPILEYDKAKQHERFETVLEKAVAEFSEEISPLVYDGHIYYLRLRPKAGYSLPSDFAARRDSLERHAPFDVHYYRHTEDAFFRLCNYYVNLYAQNHRAQKQNGWLRSILVVGALFLIAVLGVWLNVGG